MQETPYMLAKLLERTIARIVSGTDIYDLEAKPRELVASLKRKAGDARLDVRDYEYADTRRDQLAHAGAARKRLQDLRADILAASEHGIFNTVDVVQLSTWIDSLVDQLA